MRDNGCGYRLGVGKEYRCADCVHSSKSPVKYANLKCDVMDRQAVNARYTCRFQFTRGR